MGGGAALRCGYPGTPSTEVLEAFAAMPDVTAEWAPNEKVALEVAAGASLGGRRALVTMKHVGLNVAADPLFTLAYTGVSGGLVSSSRTIPGCIRPRTSRIAATTRRSLACPCSSPPTARGARLHQERVRDVGGFDTPVFLRSTTRALPL